MDNSWNCRKSWQGRCVISLLNKVDAVIAAAFLASAFLALPIITPSVSAQASANALNLVVGSYAIYQESNLSLQYLTGYFSGGLDVIGNQLNYLNGTSLRYEELQLGWKVVSTQPDSVLVNYTIRLEGFKFVTGSTRILSETVSVSQSNESAYSTNGTRLGTWPYWLSAGQAASFGEFIPFHGFLRHIAYANGTLAVVSETPAEFLALSQGGSAPYNSSVITIFVHSSLQIPTFGTFKTDRMIVSYPVIGPCSSTGQGARICSIPTPNWVAIFDRNTGLMLAYDHDSALTDDVMLHSALRVQDIAFPSPALILNSTNVSLTSDSTSAGVSAYLYLGIGAAAVVVIVIASITLGRKTMHHRLVKVLAGG